MDLGGEEKKPHMAMSVATEIRITTRGKLGTDEKIRIVLEDLRGKISVSQLCRHEGIISPSLYYQWSNGFWIKGRMD